MLKTAPMGPRQTLPTGYRRAERDWRAISAGGGTARNATGRDGTGRSRLGRDGTEQDRMGRDGDGDVPRDGM